MKELTKMKVKFIRKLSLILALVVAFGSISAEAAKVKKTGSSERTPRNIVTEAPVTGGTVSEPATIPVVVKPVTTPLQPISDGSYTIDNNLFGISSNGANARQTTDGINNALVWAKSQGYTKVKFAAGTYLIQCNWNNRYCAPTDGILVPSDMTLDLGASVFVMETNSYHAYSIISVVNQKNVTITGGTLVGDRDSHIYAYAEGSETHEWGFGICISASSNVVLEGVTIRNTTGDGIILEGSYESLSNGGSISSEIKIMNCNISNSRRQGISVIGAVNSEISGNTIYNIAGTDPQFGIDVETEFDYPVDNLKIHDNTIYGCSAGAINCNKGSNYEVYANKCIGNNIYVAKASYVRIYGNTIENSSITVSPYASYITVENNILNSGSWISFI